MFIEKTSVAFSSSEGTGDSVTCSFPRGGKLNTPTQLLLG